MQLSKVSSKDLQVFTQQLSTLLTAKLALLKAIDVLSKEQKNNYFKSILKKISKKLADGQSFHKTLKLYPSVFSVFYCNMILIGEQTGTVDKMLEKVNDYLVEKEDLKQTVIQAVTYPVIIILITFFAFIFLMTFVVPEFESMFQDYQSELPTITLFVLDVSRIISGNILFIFLLFPILLSLFIFFRRNKKFALVRSKLLLNTPLIRHYSKHIFISRICLILSVLLEAKVNLIESLEIARASVKNVLVDKEIKRMISFVSRGDKLTQSISKSNIFPEMVVQMLTVGEETAKLYEMLGSVATYYKKELDNSITRMTTLLEPLIIIILGILVGFIVVAIYLPMFELSNMMY